VQQRIVGIETEFGLSYVPKGLGRLSNEEAAAALFKPVLDEWRSTNVFLPNGGRLYLDVGSHPEYASAECASIEELLAQERAGELLLARLARQAPQRRDPLPQRLREIQLTAHRPFKHCLILLIECDAFSFLSSGLRFTGSPSGITWLGPE